MLLWSFRGALTLSFKFAPGDYACIVHTYVCAYVRISKNKGIGYCFVYVGKIAGLLICIILYVLSHMYDSG